MRSIIAIIILMSNGCTTFSQPHTGPLSLSEMRLKLDKVGSTFPIYIPGNDELTIIDTTLFYLYDDGSMAYLKTSFFTQNDAVQNDPVATMYTKPIAPPLEITRGKSEKIRILWAHDLLALTCLVPPDTPYQTCLFWQSNGYWFEFYSILSLDKTATLVNSLKKVR
jgi:hypothetical protein